MQSKKAAHAAVTAAVQAATTNTKTEKASFDKTAYAKEQKAIVKKWEEFFKAEDLSQSSLSLVDLYTNVSRQFYHFGALLIFDTGCYLLAYSGDLNYGIVRYSNGPK